MLRMTKRAVLYARKSTKDDDKSEQSASVADQLKQCRAYAAKQGWTVVGEYKDDGKSGLFDRSKRPELDEAFKRIEAGDVDVIVMKWTSRLSRDEKDRAELADILDTLEVEWHAFDDGGKIDRTTYTGYISYSINTLIDVAFSKRVRENWKRAHQRRIEDGLPATGRAHFGYTYYKKIKGSPDPSRYEVNEVQAKALETCYKRYAQGIEGFHTLSLWLNAQGFTTTTGNTWKPNTLTKTMDSGFNVGYITTAMDIKGIHDPIIDEPLWLAYRAQRKRAAGRGRKASGEALRWWLAGLIKCGECGGVMSRNSKAKDTVYCRAQRMSKTCTGRSTKGIYIENAVGRWLGGHLDTLDSLTPEDATRSTALAEYEAAQEEIAKINTALAALEDKHLMAEVTNDVYLQTKQMLTERLVTAQDALNEAASQVNAPQADIEALRGREGNAPWTPDQLAALRALVSRVEVQDKAVVIVPVVGESASFERAGLMPRCEVSGCERQAFTQGLCRSHTSRAQKAGVFDALTEALANGRFVTEEEIEKVTQPTAV